MKIDDSLEENGKGDVPPISIYVDRKLISFTDLAELYVALDQLYRAIGGSGLMISDATTINLHKQPDSSYNLHAGEESLFTPDATREEVHDAIHALVTDSFVQTKAIADLEKRFSPDIWNDMYPTRFALQAVLDACVEDRERAEAG